MNKTFLMKYLRPYIWVLIILLILIIGNTSINIINPHLISKFIDAAITGGSSRYLLFTALFSIGLSILGQCITILDTYMSQKIAWRTTNLLREDLMEHCLHLGPVFHQSKTPGEMIERIDGDVSFLSSFLSTLFISMISNFFLLAGVLVSLFIINLWVGISFLAFTLLMFVFIKKVNKHAVPYWMKNREASGRLFGFIEERLYGIEAIKHNRAIKPMIAAMGKLMRSKLLTERKAFMASTMTWSSTAALFALSTAVALTWGVVLFSKGSMTVGTVLLIYNYVQLLRTPIEQLSNQFQDIQRASASIRRIDQIFNTKEDIAVAGGAKVLDRPVSIEFKDVSFSYNNERNTLKNISFSIPSGKSLSIVGRTGSGKTTIAKLLFRFFEYNKGEIYINGCSVREYSIKSIRQNISFVTQEVQMFHGTLRDNIVFFNPDISDTRIEQVFANLDILDWYNKFPNGLDTMIHGENLHLSDGESQVIALVRIALRNASVIIMDEATASMDPFTESTIMKAVNKIATHRTLIIIAHRPTTIENADYILVLENGLVLEYDKRENLVSNPGSEVNKLFYPRKGELPV